MALGIWLTLQSKARPRKRDYRQLVTGVTIRGVTSGTTKSADGAVANVAHPMLQNPLIWLLGVSYVLVYVSGLRLTTGAISG